MAIDILDSYADAFKCSDKYRDEFKRHMNSVNYYDKEKAAEQMNSFNVSYVSLLYNMLSNADRFSTFTKESLLRHASFKKLPPRKINIDRPEEPLADSVRYAPEPVKVSFLQRLINTNAEAEAREEAERKAQQSFAKDFEKWEREVERFEKEQEDYKSNYSNWLKGKRAFEEALERENEAANNMLTQAAEGEPSSVARLFEYVIDGLFLPFDFAFVSSTEYQPENRRLIINVDLPTLENLPNIKAVKYIKSKYAIEYKYQSDTFMKKLYDTVIYQVVLIILYHCFEYNEVTNVIDAVALNGFVNTIEPASGKSIHPCILSVSTDRTSFEDIVLDSVDAKAWFKSVKGVSAAKIELSTPVPPIIKLNKNDHRFVESYEVANQIDDSTNLASMDWKDFENLVRELFEEEFKVNGGEVKVTQASRDGGVDAIAFDPDPIRGGKIVIQAKRYTNVVGVSAVRDLYGTVMNEGANKGILVTTSGYGNDAYEFAKDKPITLLDGGNLLSLLEKHGHKARIDMKEAKELL